MRIRRALPEEFSALTEIIQQATRHWGYPEHWISISRPDPTVSADFITNNDVYVAEENGQLQGFYSLAANPQKLEELWIAPAHFGTGVGKQLFLHAMERAESAE